MWKIVDMVEVGGNCLNACDTPPYPGIYPTGTYAYFTVPPGSPSGFPVGMKIIVMM